MVVLASDTLSGHVTGQVVVVAGGMEGRSSTPSEEPHERDAATGRTRVNAHTTPFLPYDLEGPVQPEMSWLPLSFDRETQLGTYLMRMQPGAVTIAHDHPGMEEFLVLEGDLVDSDGTTFGPGDFVSYEPGTHHNSWTETGCLLAVFEWRKG